MSFWFSSFWPFGDLEDSYPSPSLKVLSAPPSPRLVQTEPTFMIIASLYTTRTAADPAPILYLNTKSIAIADYCLLGRLFAFTLGAVPPRLVGESPEHIEVCLRMRRCGAVEISPPSWMYYEGCDLYLEAHLNNLQYVFGWPPPTSSEESATPTQSVCFLRIHRNSHIR